MSVTESVPLHCAALRLRELVAPAEQHNDGQSAWVAFRHFAELPVLPDPPLAVQDDGERLRFAWGTAGTPPAGTERAFLVTMVRELAVHDEADGRPHVEQLLCEIALEPSDELELLGGDVITGEPGAAAEWVEAVESSAGRAALAPDAGHTVLAIEVRSADG